MRNFKWGVEGVGGILKYLYLALVQCSILTKVALGGYWLYFLFALHTISSNYKIILLASSKAWHNVSSLLKGAQKSHLIHGMICYQKVHLFIVVMFFSLLSALFSSETAENICFMLFEVETLAVWMGSVESLSQVTVGK